MKKALRLGAVIIVLMAAAVGILSDNASAASLSDVMTVNPEYLRYMEDVANGNGGRWGLIPNKYIAGSVVAGGRGSDVTLPARYSLNDSGYATTLKNQGTDGICWAYSTSTSIESNLKKTAGVSMEFSAKQLDYMTASTQYADYIRTRLGVSRNLGEGSNFFIASVALSSKYAPVEESEFFAKMKANDPSLSSYSSFRQYNDRQILFSVVNDQPYTKPMSTSSVLSKADYLVTDSNHYFGDDANVISKVKSSIYANGAMYVGTFAPETNNCWDAATKTVIDRGDTICGAENGHAMTVIGWDDNHTYTDPASGTSKTGAFIVQNSWGKSSIYSDYGVTVDDLMQAMREAGQLDNETEERIEAIREELVSALNNYDAEEYVYLAYDSLNAVDFGGITGVAKNQWKEVYDSVGAKSITVDANGVAKYQWSTGENEEINALSFGAIAPLAVDSDYTLTIDGGKGSVTKTVHIAAGEANRIMIDLDKPVSVNGNVMVTLSTNAGALSEETVYYMMPVLYAVESEEIVVPDTSTPSEPEPSTSSVAAPDTGMFTGGKGGVIIAGTLVVVVTGVGCVVMIGHKNRKKLFDRVNFENKHNY